MKLKDLIIRVDLDFNNKRGKDDKHVSSDFKVIENLYMIFHFFKIELADINKASKLTIVWNF